MILESTDPTRSWLRRLSVLVVVAALAACGSGEILPGAAAPDPTEPADVVDTAADPPGDEPSAAVSSFTDAKGRTVDVPADPQRILALSEPTLDGMLALGLVPLGTTSGRGQHGVSNYLAEAATGVPIVADVASPNLEMIAAADPDLILADGTTINDDALLARMADIAPTVWLSPAGSDWKVAFAALGEAVGQPDRAAAVLADYEARAAKVAAGLGPNAGATVSIVRWGLTAPSLILKELPASRVVADVGLTRPPAQDRDGLGHSEPVSLERLDTLDADWVFFGALGMVDGQASAAGVAASQEALARAVQVPGFANLNAHRNGRIVTIDGSVWTSAGGPLAAGLVLDDIAAALSTS